MKRIVSTALVVGALGTFGLASPAGAKINCKSDGPVNTCNGGQSTEQGGVGVHTTSNSQTGEFVGAGGSGGLNGTPSGPGGSGQNCVGNTQTQEIECHGRPGFGP